jgi:hypothetical protein
VIDSWPKLYLILWLVDHPEPRPTCRELARTLYLGDEGLVKGMLLELREAGLVVEVEGRCALSEDPEVQVCLQYLQQTYADPVARQELIARIRAVGSPGEDRTDGLGPA